MKQIFERNILELLGPDATDEGARPVLLAVSGGPDSMAMAHLFAECKIPFAIAHCNFHLRGAEGDEDTLMVKKWARAHKVRFHRADFQTEQIASKRGISVEMAARDLRYNFFATTVRREGYKAVAVAHHKNDNAETMLLNLLRGTGTRGLCGMRRSGSLPVPGYEDIPLIRPLLTVSRDSIMAYLRREKVPFRLDSSNAENHYKRNKLRNQVFPILKEINPSFVDTLLEDAKRIGTVNDIAEDYYFQCKERIMSGNSIDIDRLTATPHWEYILYRILAEHRFTPDEASMAEDLIKSHAHLGGKTIGGAEKVMLFAFGEIIISKPRDFWEEFDVVRIEGPGEYEVGQVRFSVTEEPWDGTVDPRQEGCILADAEALPFPFIARNWKRGDYMRPLGLKGRKKLQDIFSDLKYNLAEKHDAVIIVGTAPGHGPYNSPFRVHVSALLPSRIDERLRVTPDTKSVIRIKMIKGTR